MTDDIFERIRQRRREALADAMRRRGEQFNPFRCGPIAEVAIEEGPEPARSTVTLRFHDGSVHCLTNFYSAHATHLARLKPDDRIEYLRSIWLNYSRSMALLNIPSQ